MSGRGTESKLGGILQGNTQQTSTICSTFHHPLLDINTSPTTKNEFTKAIKSLKSSKAVGPDSIPPEALKADIQTSTDMLHPLLDKIWEQERVPEEWKKGQLVKLPKKGKLSSCNNWRGIMLLSIPWKVLTKIILERLKTALDKTL